MKKNFLVTSIGGLFSHDLVRALRVEKNSFILGTDMNETPNAYFLDKFEKIYDPKKNKKKYISKLFELCKKYKINCVLPCSENECLEISKNLKKLQKMKIRTSVSNYETIKNVMDKHLLFKAPARPCKTDAGELSARTD